MEHQLQQGLLHIVYVYIMKAYIEVTVHNAQHLYPTVCTSFKVTEEWKKIVENMGVYNRIHPNKQIKPSLLTIFAPILNEVI